MITTLAISALTIVEILISLILKPTLTIKGKSINLYWIIALAGALTLIITGGISTGEAWAGLTRDTSVNPLKLLVIFFGMTILSVFLDEMNLFEYLASFAVRHAKSTQKSLFLMLYVMVSALTAVTSNDVVILTFTPFILHFAKKVRINPMPFLIAEFVAANTLSMTLIIGNPTNIYLATSGGIDFFEYLKVMIIPSFACSVCAYFILRALFHKQLREPLHIVQDDVQLGDRFLLITGIVHLVVAIVALSVCSYIGIEMWVACGVIVLSLLVVSFVYIVIKKQSLSIYLRVAKRLPYALAPFVLSMFVIVLSLNKCGFTEMVASLMTKMDDSIFLFGFASFLSANVFNNIPMSVLFSDIISFTTLEGAALKGALYASVIGSNIGAYLSPVGALAGIMWLSILKRNGHPLSFVHFMGYGIVVSVPVMIVAIATLHLGILFI
ncbi:MAG: hypothetical protein IJ033_00780 [Clostridia bacterium]|nr:hypothetical protein [Clostridia bacterium]